MNGKKIVFIGGGNMASALIGGLVQGGVDAAHITVVDVNEAQLTKVSAALGVRTATVAHSVVADVDVIVWAVKPQVMRSVIAESAPFAAQPLHISIAAGIRLSDLSRWLVSDRVVRAMPNTSSLVGAGVTGLLAGEGVSPEDRALAEHLLASAGSTFWVESDEAMNAVTAVSGSGPAYVFHFLEGYQAAAERLGFSAERARELALQVAQGALQQARSSTTPLSELRLQVTSKKGTTEAAIHVLDQCATQDALAKALQAAADRGRELGEDLGGDA
jgi:pyrroline-5-carboxylate reductase